MGIIALCIDCKHRFDVLGDECLRPVPIPFEPVRGRDTKPLFARCATERTDTTPRLFGKTPDRCGYLGKYFEPKPTPAIAPPTQGTSHE